MCIYINIEYWREYSFKKFAKFIRKHLCQSLFFNKVADLRPVIYQKRDSGTGIFLWILRNFWDHFFSYNTSRGCIWVWQWYIPISSIYHQFFFRIKSKQGKVFSIELLNVNSLFSRNSLYSNFHFIQVLRQGSFVLPIFANFSKFDLPFDI